MVAIQAVSKAYLELFRSLENDEPASPSCEGGGKKLRGIACFQHSMQVLEKQTENSDGLHAYITAIVQSRLYSKHLQVRWM